MLRPEQIGPAEAGAGCTVMVRHAATIGPLTWLELMPVGPTEPPVWSACWMAAVPPAIGTHLDVRVTGEGLAYGAADRNPTSR